MAQQRSLGYMKRLFSICIFLSALILTLLTGLVAVPKAAHADEPQKCDRYVLPVTLSPLELITYHVTGWLCYQGSLSQHHAVQLLVHGGTYGHIYWNYTYQPDMYSYVQYMTKAGYATFNFDRIGVGESDHPSAALVTIQADAYVLSQLVSDLKTGAYGGPAFQKILLVGHSVGSAISIAEAANPQFAHVDGVILSGFLHFVDPVEVVRLANDIYPANLDPDPRFKDLPPGYFTTKPSTRGQIFYDLPNADSQVIATDEQTKETITDNEFTTFFSIANSPLSQNIKVPVLEVVGQDDALFCLGTFSCTNRDTVQRYESTYYAPQAQLQLLVIPQAGHDLNLQKTASTGWYPQALTWILAHIYQ